MSSDGSPYVYQPLSGDEIRILELMPIKYSGDIEISISRIHASTSPTYEALSYAWGHSDRTHRVAVKGPSQTYVSVAQNLFIALDHLRLPEVSRILWIDAICINQDDLAERSAQVQKMGSLYKAARQVVIWLGEESQDSAQAMELLRGLGEGLELGRTSGGVATFYEEPDSLAKELKESSKAMVEREPDFVAIKSLLEREWFTRLWVIQEMTLASNATIVVGNKEIPLQIFKAAIVWLYHTCRSSDRLSEAIGISLVLRAFQHLDCDSDLNIVALQISTSRTRCLDPRDRIYAILSLLSPAFSAKIVPDYSRSPRLLFKDAVLYEIEESKMLTFLRLGRFHHPNSAPTLPSWVFDFSIPCEVGNLVRPAYASGRSRQESLYDPIQESLAVHGRKLCSIDRVFEAVPLGAKCPEIFTICKAWKEISSPDAPQIFGTTWVDAFITTIFCASIAHVKQLDNGISLSDLTGYFDAFCERNCSQPDFYATFPENLKGTIFAIESCLPGRRFFMSNEGFMGICPRWAQKEDIIVVLLGCGTPLVLRQTVGGRYQVGGECYVYGMMEGDGLLGPLDANSRHDWKLVDGYEQHVVVNGDGIPTQLDPRAGPLPAGWKVFYGREKSDTEFEGGGLRAQLFYHPETEKWSYFDPRLTSENLRKLGTDIQEFVIV